MYSIVVCSDRWHTGAARRTRRVTDWRRERKGGDGRVEGSSAIADGREAEISFRPDVDGTGSDSLLDSILPTVLKNDPMMCS